MLPNRNPGTYRSEYVEELYQRYGDIDGSSPLCPQRPEWVTELDDIGGGAGVKGIFVTNRQIYLSSINAHF